MKSHKKSLKNLQETVEANKKIFSDIVLMKFMNF